MNDADPHTRVTNMEQFGVVPVCRKCGATLNGSIGNWLVGDSGVLMSTVSGICQGCDTPIYYMDSGRAEYILVGTPVQA